MCLECELRQAYTISNQAGIVLVSAHRVLSGHMMEGRGDFSRLFYSDASKTRKHLLHLRFSKKAVL
jgi:hypothetical protein